jgi:hypothetical protein
MPGRIFRLVRDSLWWQVPMWLVAAVVVGAVAGLERGGEVLFLGVALAPTLATPLRMPLAGRAKLFAFSLAWLFATLILLVLAIAAASWVGRVV